MDYLIAIFFFIGGNFFIASFLSYVVSSYIGVYFYENLIKNFFLFLLISMGLSLFLILRKKESSVISEQVINTYSPITFPTIKEEPKKINKNQEKKQSLRKRKNWENMERSQRRKQLKEKKQQTKKWKRQELKIYQTQKSKSSKEKQIEEYEKNRRIREQKIIERNKNKIKRRENFHNKFQTLLQHGEDLVKNKEYCNGATFFNKLVKRTPLSYYKQLIYDNPQFRILIDELENNKLLTYEFLRDKKKILGYFTIYTIERYNELDFILKIVEILIKMREYHRSEEILSKIKEIPTFIDQFTQYKNRIKIANLFFESFDFIHALKEYEELLSSIKDINLNQWKIIQNKCELCEKIIQKRLRKHNTRLDEEKIRNLISGELIELVNNSEDNSIQLEKILAITKIDIVDVYKFINMVKKLYKINVIYENNTITNIQFTVPNHKKFFKNLIRSNSALILGKKENLLRI
jgi:hypothetical protein